MFQIYNRITDVTSLKNLGSPGFIGRALTVRETMVGDVFIVIESLTQKLSRTRNLISNSTYLVCLILDDVCCWPFVLSGNVTCVLTLAENGQGKGVSTHLLRLQLLSRWWQTRISSESSISSIIDVYIFVSIHEQHTLKRLCGRYRSSP